MNRTDARLRRGCLTTAALVFLTIVILIFLDNSIRFTAIQSAFSRGDMICGINEPGPDSYVFLVSAETGRGNFIRRPHLTDRGVSSFEDPYISADGKPYFTERLIREDGSVVLQRYSWDPVLNRIRKEAGHTPSPALSFDAPSENTEGENVIPKTDSLTQAVGYVWQAPAGTRSEEEQEKEQEEEDPKEAFIVPEENVTAEEAARTGGPVKELYDLQHGTALPVTKLKILEQNGSLQISLIRGETMRTVTGVTRSSGRTAVRLLIALAAAVLLYRFLNTVGVSVSRAGKVPWLMIRVSFFSIFLMVLIMPGFNEMLRHYLYAYGCRNVLFHCANAAAQQGRFMDPELLERLVTEDEMLSPENLDAIWKTEGRAALAKHQAFSMAPAEEKSLMDLARSEEYCIVCKKFGSVVLVSRSTAGKDSVMFVPDGSLRTLLDRIFADGKTRSYISILSREKYAEVFVPVDLSSGRRVLVGARMPVSGILYSMYRQRKVVNRSCLAICLVMLAVMLFTILRCLKPLSGLTRAVAAFAGGDLSARAEVKGHNEISLTAICFNEMADTLEKQSAGAESYRRFYEAFLPATLLRRFSGKNLADALEHGSGYGAAAVCMSVGSSDSAEGTEQLFGNTIRIAHNEGGHLASLTETGMKLVYPESCEAALRTAAALEQAELRNGKLTVPVGIASGPVQLYVAGSARRKSVADIDTGEAAALCSMARSLEIPVILTEKIMLALGNSGHRYHFRCLGRIGTASYVPEQPLYELLDADRHEVREAKERTGKIFEHGIRAYAAGDYFTARNDMIRVMDDNPGDRAARSYILNCDRKEPPAVCQTEF